MGATQVFRIIADYARYLDFMPSTERTQIPEVAENVSLVDITLGLPLGKIKKYRLRQWTKTAGDVCHLH